MGIGTRTVIQLHRHLAVLVVVIKLRHGGYGGLGSAFLACALDAEGRALVGLAHDLLEWLEFVGVVDIGDSNTCLLAMLEVIGAVWNVLLRSAAYVADTALACRGGHGCGWRRVNEMLTGTRLTTAGANRSIVCCWLRNRASLSHVSTQRQLAVSAVECLELELGELSFAL